jgi:hypothetical protein
MRTLTILTGGHHNVLCLFVMEDHWELGTTDTREMRTLTILTGGHHNVLCLFVMEDHWELGTTDTREVRTLTMILLIFPGGHRSVLCLFMMEDHWELGTTDTREMRTLTVILLVLPGGHRSLPGMFVVKETGVGIQPTQKRQEPVVTIANPFRTMAIAQPAVTEDSKFRLVDGSRPNNRIRLARHCLMR